MPTKRKRKSHMRREPITPTALAFLYDEQMPEDGNVWEDFSLRYNHAPLSTDGWEGGDAAKLWAEHGPEVTAAWIKAHPGTRPRCWWRFSAPRHPEQHPHRFWPAIDPRRHVGGPGEVDDSPTCAEFGIPRFRYQEKPFSKPTMIESQTAYLDRHGLLTADERRRLPAGSFDPVPFEETDE